MAKESPSSSNQTVNQNNFSNGTKQDPIQNPASPQYLHPGENLSAVLVMPPLNEAWEACKQHSHILDQQLPFSTNFSDTISIDNAHNVWLDLQERFTKGNYFRMLNLLQDFNSMKQGDQSLTPVAVPPYVLMISTKRS